MGERAFFFYYIDAENPEGNVDMTLPLKKETNTIIMGHTDGPIRFATGILPQIGRLNCAINQGGYDEC